MPDPNRTIPPDVVARVFEQMGGPGRDPAAPPPAPGRVDSTPLGRLAALEDRMTVAEARLDAIAPATNPGPPRALTVDPSPTTTPPAPLEQAAIAAAAGPHELDPDAIEDTDQPWPGADRYEAAVYFALLNLQAAGWQVQLTPPT